MWEMMIFWNFYSVFFPESWLSPLWLSSFWIWYSIPWIFLSICLILWTVNLIVLSLYDSTNLSSYPTWREVKQNCYIYSSAYLWMTTIPYIFRLVIFVLFSFSMVLLVILSLLITKLLLICSLRFSQASMNS